MEIGHARFKFCLLVAHGAAESRTAAPATFAFFLRSLAEWADPTRRFQLTPDDIARINPNTRTAPIFRSRRDADLTRAIHARVPVLWREARERSELEPAQAEENPWGIRFAAMFHMSGDSDLFKAANADELRNATATGNHLHTPDGRHWVPLYEAKMVHHYDHRFGDYALRPEGSQSTALPDVPLEMLADPGYTPTPRYWVDERLVEDRLDGKWDRGWLLGWRDICRSTDERTVIAGVIPRVATGDTFLLAFPAPEVKEHWAALAATMMSFVLDFAARQKVGGTHLKYNVCRQLPILPPTTFTQPCPWSPTQTLSDWIRPRVLELTYTAHDLAGFARDLGYDGPPFGWDPERRWRLRCELDAAFFHLYGLGRADVEYVLGTFPIVARREVAEFGEFRSLREIVRIYDAMAAGVYR